MSKQPFTSNSLPPVAGRASSFTEGVTIDPVHLLGRDASAYSDVSGPATVSDHVASPLYVGALPLGSHTSIENEDANPPFITRPSELPSQRRTNRRQESQNLFTRYVPNLLSLFFLPPLSLSPSCTILCLPYSMTVTYT
eukprot:TRINITY_DN1368_c0_g1_i1.p1 TRINITY_DN1368_c0_g1~~TRINITY_DN1368_c0_g1_i1.p1  ORF type:complete len:139 (+),score=8.30 TRINITY_DN1368_c0_g1_i1:659-1075(+)